MATRPRPRRYTSPEVCALFGVSRKTLWRWKKLGVLAPVGSDGYRNVYDADKVDALRAVNARTP